MFIDIRILIDSRKVDYNYMISNNRLFISFKIESNHKKLILNYDDNIYDDFKIETGDYSYEPGYLEIDLEKNNINFFEFSIKANYKYYVKLVYEYVNGKYKKEELIKILKSLYDLNKENEVLDRIKVLEEMNLDDKFLYYEIDKLIEELLMNEYYDKLTDKMTDYDFLNIITYNISSNRPYGIDQKKLDELIDVAKSHKDTNENIWRLAMNYDGMGYDFSKIEEYFVSIKDIYYLQEYISGVYQKNLDYIVDLLIKQNDKDFIKKVLDNELIIRDLNNEHKNKLYDIIKM